jgi:uncharacterized membrane protein YeaQ/YmgE (transglycosylase-associated protein family)
MNLIIWLVAGGLIGCAAGAIVKADVGQSMLGNVLVGSVGAMLGGWAISPLIGAGTFSRSDLNPGALCDSLAGAVLLLGAVNMVRRGWGGQALAARAHALSTNSSTNR